ncbi:MAG: hypothetical protein JWP70_1467 [Leifsonia sp.]|nr:hypothetical protein [Leifsonia sp.]
MRTDQLTPKPIDGPFAVSELPPLSDTPCQLALGVDTSHYRTYVRYSGGSNSYLRLRPAHARVPRKLVKSKVESRHGPPSSVSHWSGHADRRVNCCRNRHDFPFEQSTCGARLARVRPSCGVVLRGRIRLREAGAKLGERGAVRCGLQDRRVGCGGRPWARAWLPGGRHRFASTGLSGGAQWLFCSWFGSGTSGVLLVWRRFVNGAGDRRRDCAGLVVIPRSSLASGVGRESIARQNCESCLQRSNDFADGCH